MPDRHKNGKYSELFLRVVVFEVPHFPNISLSCYRPMQPSQGGYVLPGGLSDTCSHNEERRKRYYLHILSTNCTMSYKVIASGHLEFGNARSFERMVQSYQQRLETYYKNDIFLRPEELWTGDSTFLSIPRMTVHAVEKTWRNTINLLESIVQFAMAGSVSLWKLDNGAMLEHVVIEPRCEKSAVQSFLLGRELISKGKRGEAKEALNQAIEKFERHALAYERRGYVNFMLNNYEDAIYDFSKSIDINPNNPEAYVGRALVRMATGGLPAALSDVEMALKTSIPHQPIYWKARRLKGEIHLEREEYTQAEKELRDFTKRIFKAEDPNGPWLRRVWHNYGRTLLALSRYTEAVDAFNRSMELDSVKDNVSMADQLYFRGVALQKAGQEGYSRDLYAAAEQGNAHAARLLEINA